MGGDSGSTAINRKGKKGRRKTPSFIRSNKLLKWQFMAWDTAMQFKLEIT